MIRVISKLFTGIPQVKVTLPQSYCIVSQYKFASLADKMQKKQS